MNSMTIARRFCAPLPPLIAQRVREALYSRERARRDDRAFRVKALTGSFYEGRTGDYHGYTIGVHGFSEWRNVALAAALCAPGDTIVEVGANIGTETISFADLVGPMGRVFAFEPAPENAAALRHNRDLNRLAQLVIIPCAVGDRETTVTFHLPPREYSGTGHVGPSPEEGTIQVACVTLDDMAEIRARPVRMIFVDAEGSDLAVLRGARRVIRDDRPFLVLEASQTNLGRQGGSVADLRAEVVGMGYRPFLITRFGLSPVDLDRLGPKSDWLCAPQGLLPLVPRAARSILACGILPCLPHIHPLLRRTTD
jgi:FkbM family methyltransferase